MWACVFNFLPTPVRDYVIQARFHPPRFFFPQKTFFGIAANRDEAFRERFFYTWGIYIGWIRKKGFITSSKYEKKLWTFLMNVSRKINSYKQFFARAFGWRNEFLCFESSPYRNVTNLPRNFFFLSLLEVFYVFFHFYACSTPSC